MGCSIISNYNKNSQKITLCDWISKVKCKKRDLRRKRSSHDLRIAAMLTTALMRAEHDMRQKQQERATKWAELHIQINQTTVSEDEAAEERHKKEIEDLWNSELNGLDNFINSLNQIKTSVVR